MEDFFLILEFIGFVGGGEDLRLQARMKLMMASEMSGLISDGDSLKFME